MVGQRRECTWDQFVNKFRKPQIGEFKDQFGAWTACEFRKDIKREDYLVACYCLVVDVDDNGDTLEIAGRLDGVQCFVHETFSSTPEAPRCRIVFELMRPCLPFEYRAAHAVIVERLRSCGVVTDPAAKDPGRLSFLPVRRADQDYVFAECHGRPICAVTIAKKHPLPVDTYETDYKPKSLERVQAVALEREADNVRATGPGQRHEQMLCAALRLSRPQLNLDARAIEAALMPAFLAATDGRRKGEGLRILRDAWRKNRG